MPWYTTCPYCDGDGCENCHGGYKQDPAHISDLIHKIDLVDIFRYNLARYESPFDLDDEL